MDLRSFDCTSSDAVGCYLRILKCITTPVLSAACSAITKPKTRVTTEKLYSRTKIWVTTNTKITSCWVKKGLSRQYNASLVLTFYAFNRSQLKYHQMHLLSWCLGAQFNCLPAAQSYLPENLHIEHCMKMGDLFSLTLGVIVYILNLHAGGDVAG